MLAGYKQTMKDPFLDRACLLFLQIVMMMMVITSTILSREAMTVTDNDVGDDDECLSLVKG